MTKTPWIVGAALAATLAATGYAHAMPGSPGRDAPKTRAEVQTKIADHFKKADANGDGYVTKAEADAAREAMKAKFAERREARKDQRFAMLDTDKNGQISKEEFTAPRDRGEARDGGKGKGGKHKAHRGWRGHGKGMGGMAMAGQWFDRADANKDGRVSLAEAQAGPLAMFDRVDTDKDGTISPAEREAARAAMRAKWLEKRGDAPKG